MQETVEIGSFEQSDKNQSKLEDKVKVLFGGHTSSSGESSK